MTTNSVAAADTQLNSDSHSYIARHWRGELALAKSYWLNGVLIVGVGGCIVFYVAPIMLGLVVFGLKYSPLEWIWAFSFLAWFGTYVWVWGGIWRSAGRYRGPWIWPLAARIAVVVGSVVSAVIVLAGFVHALG